MYLDHFGLKEPPFRITPHTDFFFDGADRGATLEALLFAIVHDEGIIKVSGEVGSGKTMLCRVLMERLPGNVETIYVATPSLGRDEILYTIADELDLKFSQGRVTLALRELQEHLIRLYSEGRRVVILIDEAHAMPEETLEQVRLLSNLESNRHKLLQIVLFGQPELDDVLARTTLRQLKDRITHSFRMRALTTAEVATYLVFRMRAAGYRGPDVFSAAAAAQIANAANGLSRRINILADKSLLAAFSENVHGVTPKQVRKAIRDSEFTPVAREGRPQLVALVALATGLLLGVLAPWISEYLSPAPKFPEMSTVKIPRKIEPGPATHALAPHGVAASATPAAPPTLVVPSAPLPAAVANASVNGSLVANPPVAPKSPLTSEQSRQIAGYPAGNARALKERIAATRKLLELEPDDAYSIELFSTDNGDAARMERFLGRARELVPLSQLYVVPSLVGRRYRLRVLFGKFPDREAAILAEKHLPPRYQRAFQTAPVSLGEVRRSLSGA